MSPKPEMLSSIMTPWMMAAVMCAALPFLHAAPGLQMTEWFGGFLPLIIALITGISGGIALTAVARWLSGFTGSWRLSWESLTASSAVLCGIISWGLPIGLIFVVDEFLRSRSWGALIGAVIWPIAGAAFGLVMRWSAAKAERS
jgi:uncharacterized BrkB/YihY/UPF0761 family membrane protein